MSASFLSSNLRKFLLCFAAGALIAGGSATKKANAEFVIGTPIKVPNVNTSAYGECDPDISADGLELYFRSARPGGYGNWDLYVAKRKSIFHPWGTPVNLGPVVNDRYHVEGPSISADGLELYFSSSRPGVIGWQGIDTDWDIWVTKRKTKDSPWQTPINLGELVMINSSYRELFPSISADDLELYFDSSRPRGTVGEGYSNIYVAKRDTRNSQFGQPENLWQINQKYFAFYPDICYNRLVLYFSGSPTSGGGYGSLDGSVDICVSTRTSKNSEWSTPINLGPNVNSTLPDVTPSSSADGRTLYFVRRSDGWHSTDIYQVSITPVLDFNADGKVDSEDFDLLNSHLGEEGPSVEYVDIYPPPFGDGKIDEKDLDVFSEYSTKEDGLMAHWELDEREGEIAHDRISSWDGVVHGNATWMPDSGKVNGALLFDGTSYVDVPFVWDPAYGPFSAFAWILGGKPGQVIISQIDYITMSRSGIWLGISPLERKLITTLTDRGRFTRMLVSESTISDDEWHHVGFVWDGSKRHLYVDEKEVAKDTRELNQLKYSNGGLHFGANKNLDSVSFWSGLIDDIKIYNKAITFGTGLDNGVEGFETGNFSQLWKTYGDSRWFITSQEKSSGNYGAQAGPIGNNENTSLEITLNCVSGYISFYRKVSSELGYDYLRFYIDDSEEDKWSGDQDWQKVDFPVTAGRKTFTWQYSKDSSMSSGSDTAWIDDIVFPVE